MFGQGPEISPRNPLLVTEGHILQVVRFHGGQEDDDFSQAFANFLFLEGFNAMSDFVADCSGNDKDCK